MYQKLLNVSKIEPSIYSSEVHFYTVNFLLLLLLTLPPKCQQIACVAVFFGVYCFIQAKAEWGKKKKNDGGRAEG